MQNVQTFELLATCFAVANSVVAAADVAIMIRTTLNSLVRSQCNNNIIALSWLERLQLLKAIETLKNTAQKY